MHRNMNDIRLTYNVKEILAKVKQNREAHARDYEIAVAEYKVKLKKLLEEKLAKLAACTTEQFPAPEIGLPAPNHHLDEYDRLIDMLSRTTQETMDMDHDLFLQVIRDEWSWKRSWDTLNSSYK